MFAAIKKEMSNVKMKHYVLALTKVVEVKNGLLQIWRNNLKLSSIRF